jgi:hypothetical protein
MNKSERHMRYLEIYRQQLRRETDAMGYGQPNGYRPNLDRQSRTSPATSWALVAVALMVLGLASAQM